MVTIPQVSNWTRIAVIALVVLGVFLSLGYGLIGLFVILLLGSMAGGALLYWLDGEGDD